MTETLRTFVHDKPRPLPVLILADVSGSMGGEKIEQLNTAIEEMLKAFSQEEELMAEIHVGVITFGGSAEIHTALSPASDIDWSPMRATGVTPMGGAFKLAKDIIEDKEKIPSRSYRPTIVLVSDGMPTDSGVWEEQMDLLINEGRSAKADRMALSIQADVEMLNKFLNDPEKTVFEVQDASKIRDFFRYVTMSVSSRSKSTNPNAIPDDINPEDF